MEDKRIKSKLNNMSDQELTFTEEDRNEVFLKIHKMKSNNIQKKSIVSISKKFAPITVSFLAVALCLFFFIPTILQENVTNETNQNNGYNETDSSGVVSQEEEYFTTLITVKAKDMDNRIYLNLVLTYSKDKKIMKVLSIPSETYAPILEKDDGSTSYDKLLFAYAHSSEGAENVRTTVSNLLDLTIDYYAVMDLENFSTLIDSMNGIDYDLQEDIRVRAINQVAFEFKKGTNHLNGEEVVALMMAADGRTLDEENLLNLIRAVINKTKNEISQTQIKEFTSSIEGNISMDHLLEKERELRSIESVSLIDGMEAIQIDGAYYIKFEKDFLNSVAEELTTFD